MPVYQIDGPQEQEIARRAKDFLKSPTNANNYLEDAKRMMGAFSGTGDPYSWGGLENGAFGPLQGAGTPMGAIPNGMADRDWLAGALQAEGGSAQDKQYIASVIGNRLGSGRWGSSLKDVILAPGQFSAFNGLTGYAGGEQGTDHWRNPTAEAYQIADQLIGGQIADQTGGALNYYTTWGGSAPVPKWGGQGFRRLPGSTHYFGTAG